MSAPRILVVVATYNERANLPRLTEAIREHAPRAELLVVDDNSPDGTGRWVDEVAQDDPTLHVLHRPGKLGLGTATVAGLRFAIEHDFDWVLTMDADLSHDPAAIPRLLEAALDPTDPVDVVIGSRYVPGGGIEGWPLHRRWMSRTINALARKMLGLSVRDCSGAFRCYRVATLRALDLDQVRSHGFAYLEELLWLLERHGARMREVPFTFVDRTHGHSKISTREAWAALGTIVRLSRRRS